MVIGQNKENKIVNKKEKDGAKSLNKVINESWKIEAKGKSMLIKSIKIRHIK
jgi:hypothetical protein